MARLCGLAMYRYVIVWVFVDICCDNYGEIFDKYSICAIATHASIL